MSSAICEYCQKALPTRAGLSRHIKNSPRCRRKWCTTIEFLNATAEESGAGQAATAPSVDNAQPEPTFVDSAEIFEPPQDVPIPRRRNMSVEEVFDKDSEAESPDDPRNFARFVEAFPMEPQRLKKGTTQFEQWQLENTQAGRDEWYPFSSESEWETVRWLVANVGQSAVEEYLKLDIVSALFEVTNHYKLN